MEKRVKIIAVILIALCWIFEQRIDNLFYPLHNFFLSMFGNWFLIIGIVLVSSIIIYRDKKVTAPADAKRALLASILITVFILGFGVYLLSIIASSMGGMFR